MAINSLVVKTKTANQQGAGTNNDVYFDIGPLGWELSTAADDFERNHTDTFGPLPLNGVSLTEDDIIWLRLQKKGLFSKNGTPDGIDGQWLPEWVELWVDGKLFAHESVGTWLWLGQENWLKQIGHLGATPSEVFARTLRMLPNDELGWVDKSVGYITTELAKKQGISGWRWASLPRASVVGYPVRPVPLSTDRLATIDLRVEALFVGGELFIYEGRSSISGPRYIRVEYLVPNGSTVSLPAQGERVCISGDVWWDTDHEWWYEIHPGGPSDVKLSLPPKLEISLRPTYSAPDVIRKDKGTYHWKGISSVPADFEDRCKAQDFTYLALYYVTRAQVELTSSAPIANARWYIEGNQVQPGAGKTVLKVVPKIPNHHSSLPPFNGTDLSDDEVTLEYEIVGNTLICSNRPDDGNYSVEVRVEAEETIDIPGGRITMPVVTARAIVSLQGDDFVMDPAYKKTDEMCRAVKALARGNFRTLPEPVSKYDPQLWLSIGEGRLNEIWDALRVAVSETTGTSPRWEKESGFELSQQIQAALIAYPEAAKKISQMLPEASKRPISTSQDREWQL